MERDGMPVRGLRREQSNAHQTTKKGKDTEIEAANGTLESLSKERHYVEAAAGLRAAPGATGRKAPVARRLRLRR